jgi:hypothetical protein
MTSLSQMAVMGAVVATLAYFPLGIALVLLFSLFGVSLDRVLTFGGTFNTVLGLFAWWLLAFVGASIYAATMFPWGTSTQR